MTKDFIAFKKILSIGSKGHEYFKINKSFWNTNDVLIL